LIPWTCHDQTRTEVSPARIAAQISACPL
jgi:hypothetical protein